MEKKFTKISKLIALMAMGTIATTSLNAQYFTEEFDDITTLDTDGWLQVNNSAPVGTTGWFQGNGTGVFPAYSGGPDSYIGVNFNSTAGTGTICNWLVTPLTTLNNGDVLTFYTRTIPGTTTFPDRMIVRYSTNGTGVDVGAGATDVGDFTNVLVDINPNLSDLDFPDGFPFDWLRFDVTISGLTGATPGYIGFQYFITDGGPTGTNSNYIGLDSVAYYAGTPAGVNTLTNAVNVAMFPNPTTDYINIDLNQQLAQNATLNIYNTLGVLVYSQAWDKANEKNNINVQSLSSGMYMLEVVGADLNFKKSFLKK